jgi:microcystin-dependent protein
MNQPFLGTIQYFAFNFAPVGWQQCSGQTLPINQNQALFSLLGVQYGGNGTTTFNLPDYRGRTILGVGTGSSGTYTQGNAGGTESTTMQVPNMPVHTHTGNVQFAANNAVVNGSPTVANTYPATGADSSRSGSTAVNAYATAVVANSYLGAPSVTIATAGSSVPFSNLSPYLTLMCAIAMTGIYPSRN